MIYSPPSLFSIHLTDRTFSAFCSFACSFKIPEYGQRLAGHRLLRIVKNAECKSHDLCLSAFAFFIVVFFLPFSLLPLSRCLPLLGFYLVRLSSPYPQFTFLSPPSCAVSSFSGLCMILFFISLPDPLLSGRRLLLGFSLPSSPPSVSLLYLSSCFLAACSCRLLTSPIPALASHSPSPFAVLSLS